MCAWEDQKNSAIPRGTGRQKKTTYNIHTYNIRTSRLIEQIGLGVDFLKIKKKTGPAHDGGLRKKWEDLVKDANIEAFFREAMAKRDEENQKEKKTEEEEGK